MDLLIGALTVGCALVLIAGPLAGAVFLYLLALEYVERKRRG